MSQDANMLIDSGWFKLEVRDNRLWLYVNSEHDNDQERRFEQLVESIAEYGLPTELSVVVVAAFNDATGQAVELCPIDALTITDGEIIVDVDPAGMECTIMVKPSRGLGKMPLLTDARKALDDNNVIMGINEELLKDIFSKQLWNEAFTIARGTPCKEGEDGWVEYLFTSTHQASPQLMEDGRADFYNLNLICSVKKGDVLALIHPPADGIDGMSIFGKQLTPKVCKKIAAPIGKNVELIDYETKIIASVEGEAIIEKNNVSVVQSHTVVGDVDFGTGNIDFVGNVIVQGNITSGFTVKASGKVEVNGAVIGGSVEAAGDVMVRSGIQGQNKGVIKTEGNLFARYIENAIIYAAQNVDGGEAIMHSEINAGGEVTVLNRKGVIVGGVLRAAKLVHCSVVGSEIGVVTIVEIGINPLSREELKNIYHDLPGKEKDLAKTLQAISILKQLEKSQSGLTSEKKTMLLSLMKTQYSLIGEVDRMKKRKVELEVELENTKQGKLRVKEFIYPGVKLTIGKAIMHVEDTLQRAVLSLDAAEIRVAQY